MKLISLIFIIVATICTSTEAVHGDCCDVAIEFVDRVFEHSSERVLAECGRVSELGNGHRHRVFKAMRDACFENNLDCASALNSSESVVAVLMSQSFLECSSQISFVVSR